MTGQKERRNRVILYTVSLLVLISVVFFLITYIIQYNMLKNSQQSFIQKEQTRMNAEMNITELSIGYRFSDLLYIRDSFRYLQNKEQGKEMLSQLWLSFSMRKGIYDQIRYIDPDGNEVIRINSSGTSAYVVAEEELQNKSSRDYVKETLKLKDNQIYVSAIDLNIENGEVETPYKPMMRFSTPVYTDDGTCQGVVVLNYLFNNLINQMNVSGLSGEGSIYMLNSDGYWLYNNSAPERAWGFMFQGRENDRFSYVYPAVWPQMLGKAGGTLITDQGVFIFNALIDDNISAIRSEQIDVAFGGVNMYLVAHIPADTQTGQGFIHPLQTAMQRAFDRFVYVYIMILLISAVIALLLETGKESRDKIRYFSQFDTMTGVYNRRMGMERLRSAIHRKNTENCQMSLCFIDINGLKQVNDSLGHESGDELILSVVNGMKDNIRQNDFVARFGGDEFLIIFEGLSADDSEMVWQRIIKGYDTINETENRPYLISASHGIEQLDCRSHTGLDDAINAADQKMYEEKRRLKQVLTIIR